jgi:aspartate aminotransferase-like enzyme
MIKKRLFTPGPVSAYPPALQAALDANIHHRTPDFKEILASVMESLRRIFGQPSEIFVFSSSGSGAMEAALTNFFSPGDEVLIATCGKFGERWIDLASRFSLKATILKYPYGEAVQPDDVRSALRENSNLRGVFVQACESSTAVQNDMSELARIVHDTDSILIADAVTGIGTMPITVQEGIDVMVTGSQKALMIPPGLAIIGVSSKAWKRVESASTPRFYFDLRAAKKAWDQNGQTSFTPATSLIISLRESLAAIEKWGIENLVRTTENRARATRAGLAAMGLPIFAKRPANAMTAVLPPDGTAPKITSLLKQKFGLQLAGGQGELKDKIFRISHMGYIDHFDTLGVLSALEFALLELGHSVELGKSLVEFQKIYAELNTAK